MEPQEKIYCHEESKYKCGKNKNCYGIVAVILLVAFAVVIGLIIGAAISGAILGALAAIIILAICNKKDKKKRDGNY